MQQDKLAMCAALIIAVLVVLGNGPFVIASLNKFPNLFIPVVFPLTQILMAVLMLVFVLAKAGFYRSMLLCFILLVLAEFIGIQTGALFPDFASSPEQPQTIRLANRAWDFPIYALVVAVVSLLFSKYAKTA